MTTTQAPPPPFDAELGAALAAVAEQIPSSLTPDMIAPMRQGNAILAVSDEDLTQNGRFTIEERSVPGLDGDPDISLLIGRPAGLTQVNGAIYHTHGGGMIVGDNRTGILEQLDWAERYGLVVVSVEYRLAPETPHPGPINDCYAGLLWTAAHADELGFEPGRILLAGGSAGGGLAAALALMARDSAVPSHDIGRPWRPPVAAPLPHGHMVYW